MSERYDVTTRMRPAGAHSLKPAGRMGLDPERGARGGSVRGAALLAAYDRPDSFASVWRCDWTPDEYQPADEGCPYCAGRMCARFDGLNCRHDRIERHGYRPGEAIR